MRSEGQTVPLTEAEQAELLSFAASAELRQDMLCTARSIRGREVSFDDYIAFATTLARLANHPRRAFLPVNDTLFKL